MLEEHVRVLELREEVMWGLVDCLVWMGKAQSNWLDFLQHLASAFFRCTMEWDSGSRGCDVPSELTGSLGPGYIPSNPASSSPPSLGTLSSLTNWSQLVSPITPFSKPGWSVMIEEEVRVSNNKIWKVLSSFMDSVFEELSNLGFLVDGGPDGDLGGESGIWRGT